MNRFISVYIQTIMLLYQNVSNKGDFFKEVQTFKTFKALHPTTTFHYLGAHNRIAIANAVAGNVCFFFSNTS